MRTTAPGGFDVKTFYKGVYTFQDWEIFPGHRVSGDKPVGQALDLLGVPQFLAGSPRVLEIGPWNGFFGFELLRRGAGELVGLGPDDPDQTAFFRTAKLLEVDDRVRYIRDSVYNIGQHWLGKFDIVMFLGVIYHLRHPLLALDMLYDHCGNESILLLDSPTIDHEHRIAYGSDQEAMREPWKAVGPIPLAVFARGGTVTPLAVDQYNWFVPNSVCLRGWVASAGFSIEREHVVADWMWLQAKRTERPFVVNLEGYNAAAPTRNQDQR
jgi:tRNA (mo5U34)-methyltransferase